MPEEAGENLGYQSAARLFEPGRLIMDPAMLRLLPIEKLRDITIIAMQANVSATKTYLEAQQNVIEELRKMKF
ncbi:MAG: hypothetical protein JNM48_12715 [Rhodospirillales bacterium]|nr:hypothetical protein [Rhodospirillales bacterium]